ncbi:unnamed protein product [Phaeothamnion confervicola]
MAKDIGDDDSPPTVILGGGLGPLTPEQADGRPMLRNLPVLRYWPLEKTGEPPPPNPAWLGESCAVRLVAGTVSGFGAGLLFGMFLGAMGDMQPIQMINGREVPQAPLREQMRAAYRQTSTRSLSMARNFGTFSALLLGTECVVEKVRAKHDVMNSVYSGCVAGAALAAKQGPQAMCIGCIGVAAFSAAIDSIMGH